MKLKCRPEDFQVEEIAEPRCAGGGFALYRLTKQSLGTPEAIEAVCRTWRISRESVGFGGLKDRHAVTSQYLSIWGGPRRDLRQTNIELTYLGQTAEPFDSKDILANRFEIVVRDLQPDELPPILDSLAKVADDGVPNYFDDQRFGSVGVSGDFIARPWCLGDFDRTLWLALAEPNEHDRPGVRDEKQGLRDHWGDWAACRGFAARPVTRQAIEHLCHRPTDFRGAFVRIPQHERRMYLGAFQSFLWNRILAETIRALFDPGALIEVEIARIRVPIYRLPPSQGVRDELDRPLPLPSARERSELGPLTSLYERVAGEFGLECRMLRVKYPRDSFFSRGSRLAVFRPAALTWETGDDEQTPEHRKLILRFDLPPGSYATVLIKRITEGG